MQPLHGKTKQPSRTPAFVDRQAVVGMSEPQVDILGTLRSACAVGDSEKQAALSDWVDKYLHRCCGAPPQACCPGVACCCAGHLAASLRQDVLTVVSFGTVWHCADGRYAQQ